MKKKLICILVLCAFYITGCVNKNDNSDIGNISIVDTSIPDCDELFSDKDNNINYDEEDLIYIDLSNLSCDSNNVEIIDNKITIKNKGTYYFTGNMLDGQIIIDINSEDKVNIILNNVTISSSSSAPLYIKTADKVFCTLEGENVISNNGTFVQFDDNNIDGAIFSKEDLTINGVGTLKVNSNYGHGIVCKDDLVLVDTCLEINALEHGIDAKDSVRISRGTYLFNCKKDGIHVENSDTTIGYIYVEDATLNITSYQDGMSASSSIKIISGNYNIKTTASSISSDTSSKGIKANLNLIINSGNFQINSSDDAIHVNESIQIDGGDFTINSGDDGIHADTSLIINDGKINITKSYEGIEAQNITINGGDISIVSSDDGINASGGNDSSSIINRPGINNFNQTVNAFISICGGIIYVNASGDGLDANGSLYITGGNIIVEGPTLNNNGALDYDRIGEIKGGTIIAIGSKGMAQNFGETSTQGSILYNLSSNQNSNSLIQLLDSNNNLIYEFTSSKSFQSILVSTPKILKGDTYTLIIGNLQYNISMSSIIYSNSKSPNPPARPGW